MGVDLERGKGSKYDQNILYMYEIFKIINKNTLKGRNHRDKNHGEILDVCLTDTTKTIKSFLNFVCL